jgi:glycosyltransferase involved in cell wall biosynthesis
VNEAYGMALLEAQAAGIPVVACGTRGVPDVVMDGRSGLLAPGGDEAKLAALSRELLTDRARRERLGAAAKSFVLGERSIDAAAERLRALLAPLQRAGALS